MEEGQHTESTSPLYWFTESLKFLVVSKTITIFGRPVYFMVTKPSLTACMNLDHVLLLSQQSDTY